MGVSAAEYGERSGSFVCDNTVGRLRRWMSILGYDVVYDPRPAREILANPGERLRGHVVIGRCPSLAREFREATGLARRLPGHPDAPDPPFVHLSTEDLSGQIAEIARRFPMDFQQTMFTRCGHCNELVGAEQPLNAVRDRVPEKTRDWLDAYRECPVCGRVYWLGSHVPRIREFLAKEAGLDLGGE